MSLRLLPHAAAALTLAASPALAEPLSVYHVGNSLTQDLISQTLFDYNQQIPTDDGYKALLGAGATVGWDIRFGQPLRTAADSPDQGGAANQGVSLAPIFNVYAESALELGDWRQVVLQPWSEPVTTAGSGSNPSTYAEELAAYKSLATLAQAAPGEVELYLYATWADTGLATFQNPPSTDAEISAEAVARWNRPAIAANDAFYSSSSVYEQLAADLAADGFDVNVINVGQVFADLIAADNGLEASDLMRDNLHASRLGRYTAAVTAASVLTGTDATLLGLPDFYTRSALVNGFTVDGITTDIVTAAQATVVRDAVAAAVPEPTTAAALALAGPALLLRRRRVA